MVERADIPCVVRKTQLDLPMPLAALDSELWVMNDKDYARASGLVKGWSHPSSGEDETHAMTIASLE
jgi:hypothetical protein